MLYNDRAVLENMHLAEAFEVGAAKPARFFSTMSWYTLHSLDSVCNRRTRCLLCCELSSAPKLLSYTAALEENTLAASPTPSAISAQLSDALDPSINNRS